MIYSNMHSAYVCTGTHVYIRVAYNGNMRPSHGCVQAHMQRATQRVTVYLRLPQQ